MGFLGRVGGGVGVGGDVGEVDVFAVGVVMHGGGGFEGAGG